MCMVEYTKLLYASSKVCIYTRYMYYICIFPLQKDNFSPKNVNVMKDKINNQTQLTPLCTVSDDSEVTMECHSPCTCSGLSTTSDTVSAPYNDRLHYNYTQPNSTYVRLAPNTNPQTYSLPNPSISLTSTVPDNHHWLKETEDGDPSTYSRRSYS